MNKVIIFDLYDTVLTNKSFNFENGLIYLYENYFSDKCSYMDFKQYADTFLPLYEKRITENIEVCLINDEIKLFFKRFKENDILDFDLVEYNVMKKMQKVFLSQEVKETLEALYKKGIRMFILSNSIFRAVATKKLLEEYGILHYFEKIYSSADYGVRKPSKKFFKIILDDILTENIKINKEDIVYVGNDYKTDVIGATSVGLKTIWLNTNKFENANKIKCSVIYNFKSVLDFV